jgi:hypothetical protein
MDKSATKSIFVAVLSISRVWVRECLKIFSRNLEQNLI